MCATSWLIKIKGYNGIKVLINNVLSSSSEKIELINKSEKCWSND